MFFLPILLILICLPISFILKKRNDKFENRKAIEAAERMWDRFESALTIAPQFCIDPPAYVNKKTLMKKWIDDYEYSKIIDRWSDNVHSLSFSKKFNPDHFKNVILPNLILNNPKLRLSEAVKAKRTEQLKSLRKKETTFTLATYRYDGIIYAIACKETKYLFIGSTTDYFKMKNKHIKMLEQKEHMSRLLQMSYDKHGRDNFEFIPIEVFQKQNVKTITDIPDLTEAEFNKKFKGLLTRRKNHYIKTLHPEFNKS